MQRVVKATRVAIQDPEILVRERITRIDVDREPVLCLGSRCITELLQQIAQVAMHACLPGTCSDSRAIRANGPRIVPLRAERQRQVDQVIRRTANLERRANPPRRFRMATLEIKRHAEQMQRVGVCGFARDDLLEQRIRAGGVAVLHARQRLVE
nr:hypothetical protein [Burkholderia pyrrocinia]